MTRRIAAALARALQGTTPPPHVHSGQYGPYVCEDPRCTSPSMDPRDY